MEGLESQCFYLAELWHISPEQIMDIPFSRRRRYIDQKDELEKKRRDNQGRGSRSR